jgi:plastocyanin
VQMSGTATVPARRLLAACVVAGALFWANPAGALSATPQPARVTVNDFYFGPAEVTIKKGGLVKWVWSSTNSYPHDVHLKKGPKGLKHKASYSTNTTAITEAHFQKKFPTAGTYRFICTIHPTEMHLTVVVRK